METLTFDINKTAISLTNFSSKSPYLVGHNTDYLCNFTACEDWNGLTKRATFHNVLTGIKKTMLLEDGACKIPYEVLDYGDLEIGLVGLDGNKTIKSSRLFLMTVQRNAADNDEDILAPDPTLLEQIMTKLAQCDKAVQNARFNQANHHLYIYLTNGDVIDAGSIPTGGSGGVLLANAYLDNENRLVLVYEDETEIVSSAPILPNLDQTLVLENNTLRVNTTNSVSEDNTLPITAAGVYTQVGNINALLATI